MLSVKLVSLKNRRNLVISLFSSMLTLSSSKKQYPLELESKKRKVERRWRYSVRLYSQWESPVVGWLKAFAEEEYQLFNI